jgi:hypothetical protein
MLPFKFYKKKTKKSDRQRLINKLDMIFSLYIRLRDADQNGICRCITSGTFGHFSDMDAGHFITRENMATRWEEENVNAQGRGDNRFKSGKQFEHGLAIDKKFGHGTASKLLIKSKSPCHFEDFELEQMYQYYKNEVKQLKIEKGILTKD